jgi:hypothetical protein
MSLQKSLMSVGALSALTVAAFAGEPVALLTPVAPAPAGEPAELTLAQRWGTPMACDSSHKLPAALEAALEKYCKPFADPAAKRAEVIEKIKYSNACFYAQTPEDFERLVRTYDLLPPSLLGEERFVSDSTVFVGNGGVGAAAGRAQPISITYSFPADGVTWGTGGSFGSGPNVLLAKLGGFFGASNVDRARELIRQSFASWRRNGGIIYTEVADDNTPETTGTGRNPARGDVRIGSYSLDGFFNVLAYNNFTISGSDMNLDADDMAAGSFYDSTNGYRFFRNTVAHEHGHGMSYIHSIPCDNTKLMEPQLSTGFDSVVNDDRRGIQRNYGDRFAGNISGATAVDFGTLTGPNRSIIERDLSTNGTTGFNGTSQDFFKFTLGSAQNVVITVDPTGGVYNTGQQSSGCTGTTASVNADQAGNLNIELRDAAGTTVLQTAASAGAGVNEVLTANGLAAGTYTVRVFDVGPNTAVNQILQTYDLSIVVAGATAPPQAIAGVNKRIGQGFPCWFRGDLHSRALQPGASITSYQWDFDGNGTFDATGAEASTTYSTVGVRNVTLRVTDSNGRTDDDTITVDVFSAVPPPPPGAFNLLSPLNGANTTDTTPTLDWSDSANADAYRLTFDDNADFSSPIINNFEVSGSEVTLSPGTVVIGSTYYWKVTAVNPFGTVASTPVSRSFTVIAVPPPCPGDLDGDGQRNTVDLVIFLGNFGLAVNPGTNGDLDNNGVVNVVDLTILLGNFGVPCN